MQSFGNRDIALYVVFSLFYAFYDHGVVYFVMFFIETLLMSATISYNFLTERYILPFGLQNRVSKRSTNMEVIATDLLRHIYKNLDNPMNKLFVKEKVFKSIRNIRHLREVGDGLGDIQYDYLKDKSAVYLFSMSRKN